MIDEIPKHKKKSKKKYKVRSDHKHEYEKVLEISGEINLPYLSERCTICGYIRSRNFVTIPTEDRNVLLCNLEEAKKIHPDLEVVYN